jgi:MFS transporter, DHA3 family, macrolide efflux protein
MWKKTGMRTFGIIWGGQVASLLGSAMTRFALMIWAYQQNQQATTLALLSFSSFATLILFSPFAGVWVDRWDRRKVLIASDLCAGCVTLLLIGLYTSGGLQIWHLYVAEALSGLCEAFQLPAYAAATTLLVPREQLARANGMRSLGFYVSKVLSPVLAGLLLTLGGLNSVMFFDTITFLIAVGTLLKVRIPAAPRSKEGLEAAGHFWQELRFGVRYIAARPGLSGILMVGFGMNFFASLTYFGIMPAMILTRSGGSELALSSVQSAMGLGGVLGAVILTVWGGPKRQIHGFLAYAGVSFLLGDFLFAVGRETLVWTFAGFSAAFFIPFIVSASRAIWQAKTPPDLQGRVLSTATTLQELPTPIGFLITGPLADSIMEPAMRSGGALSSIFGGLVGTGPGSGMGLMFLFTAVGGTLVCFGGYLFPAIRNVEDDIPDHMPDLLPSLEAAPAGD